MIPPFVYAIALCGLLALGNWFQWQRGQTLYEKAQQAKTELESLREANTRLEEAEAARARELSNLRKAHSHVLKMVADVPDDGCLSRPAPVPDDWLRGSSMQSDPAPAKPQPKARPGVAR